MKLLVCDLDNTLYDWVSYFVPSLFAMIAEAANLSGIPEGDLTDSLRKVHQKHGDVEHPYSLLECDVVKSKYPDASNEELAKIFNDAFYAFNKVRKQKLRLYEGVISTLSLAKENGIKLAAHTESRFHSVIDRVTRLELEEFFDSIYCLERTSFIRPYKFSPSPRYENISHEKIRELTHHQRKPSPSRVRKNEHISAFCLRCD